MRHLKRRYFLLLEVLIAFTIVAIAMLPLIYPHFYIYQQERKFIHKINLDIAVNYFYGGIIEQLQRNQISWNMIEEKHLFVVDQAFWRSIGYAEKDIPFNGEYQFNVIREKKNDNYGNYKIGLTLTVFPQGYIKSSTDPTKKNLTFHYIIFVSRIFKIG
jgi:hypothetical protein